MITYFKELMKRIADAFAACAAHLRAQWKRWNGSTDLDACEAVQTITTAVESITLTKQCVMNQLKRLLAIRKLTLDPTNQPESGEMRSPAAAFQEDLDFMNSDEIKFKLKEPWKQEILRQVNGATADCMDVIAIGWNYDRCITVEDYMDFQCLERGYRDLLEVYLDELQALQEAAETLVGFDETCNKETLSN